MRINPTSQSGVEQTRAAGDARENSPRGGGPDAEAFARQLSQAALSASTSVPDVDADDWPLEGDPDVDALRVTWPGPLVAGGFAQAGGVLDAVFRQAAEEARARVRHDEVFVTADPARFRIEQPYADPDLLTSGAVGENFEAAASPVSGGLRAFDAATAAEPGAAPPPNDPPPVESARTLIEAAVAASGRVERPAVEAGAPDFARSNEFIVADREAFVASAHSIRGALEENVLRDGAALSVTDVLSADLERAADELPASEASIGAMIDGLFAGLRGVQIAPEQRGGMIVEAREQAQQKIRDIARSIAPGRKSDQSG